MNASPATNDSARTSQNGALHSEMSNLIADIEEVLARAGGISDEQVVQLREAVLQKLAAAKAGVSAGGRKVAQAARAASGATNDYVHQNPWQAVGFAALAGTALGFLLARR